MTVGLALAIYMASTMFYVTSEASISRNCSIKEIETCSRKYNLIMSSMEVLTFKKQDASVEFKVSCARFAEKHFWISENYTIPGCNASAILLKTLSDQSNYLSVDSIGNAAVTKNRDEATRFVIKPYLSEGFQTAQAVYSSSNVTKCGNSCGNGPVEFGRDANQFLLVN